jgi:hypothetical protein
MCQARPRGAGRAQSELFRANLTKSGTVRGAHECAPYGVDGLRRGDRERPLARSQGAFAAGPRPPHCPATGRAFFAEILHWRISHRSSPPREGALRRQSPELRREGWHHKALPSTGAAPARGRARPLGRDRGGVGLKPDLRGGWCAVAHPTDRAANPPARETGGR